jgi:Protein of unknown function (DUF2442)
MRDGITMISPAIIRDVHVDDDLITFVLADGREVSAPTSWSVRLLRATPAQRAIWNVGGAGTHVEWPAIDEHIGVWTLLGVPEDDVLGAAGFAMSRKAVRA